MASGIRDFTVTFVSRVLVLAVGVAIQSCLAWFLEPAGRGSYAVAIMYSSLLGVLFCFGLDYAGHYFLASRKMTPSECVSAMLLLAGLASLFAVVVSLAVIHLPIPFFDKASRTAFLLATAMIPLQILFQVLALLLTSLKEFGFTAVMAIGDAVFQLAGIGLLLTVFHMSVEGAVSILLLSLVGFAVISLLYLRRKYAIRWVRPTKGRLRELLSYGARSYIGSASNILSTYIGPLLLAMYASEAEIGLFAVASGMILKISMIPDAAGNVIQPRIAGDPGGRPELAAQSARIIGLVCAAAILLVCLFARPLISVLFSEKFVPALPLVYILAPGFIIRCVAKVLTPYLNGTNHPGIVSAATVTSLVVNAIVLVALYPLLGLPAAAISMTANYVLGSVIILVGFRRFSSVPIHQVFGFHRSDVQPFGALYRAMRARLRPIIR